MIYVLGLDVSHWQNNVDWQALWDEGYRFVFIKVSQGYNHEDSRWLEHYHAARAMGFIVGAYHWFSPSINGIAQAGWFYSVIKDVEWDLPPVLDVEEKSSLSTATYAARVRACINEIRDLWQRQPMIYTSASKWKYTGNMTIADVYWWVAHWTTRSSPTLPANCPGWTVWQFACDKYDRNRFNGTYNDLLEFINQAPPPPPNDVLELRVTMVEAMVDKIVAWARSF